MKIFPAVQVAIILMLAFVLAAQYKTAPDRPSDFRDAVGSEGAAGQLQNAAPADQDSNQPAIPAPQAAESAAAQSPESADAAAQSVAADQSAKRIFSENDPWHKRLAQALGIDYPCTVETKHIGKFYNPTLKLTFDDGRRREAVVFKRYDNLSNTKYYLSKALLPRVPLTLGADGIFKNGVAMNEKFRNAGFKTLDIIATDPQKRIVVTKFLKAVSIGKVLTSALQGDSDSLQVIERLGSAFAAVHHNNLCIGDAKPDNVMLANGEFYFIDLDQSGVGGNRAWDIAEFFYFGIAIDRLPGKPRAWSVAARNFLRGYKSGGGISSVKKALSREFLVPFAYSFPIGGLGAIHAVRHEMKEAVGEDLSPETDKALGLVP